MSPEAHSLRGDVEALCANLGLDSTLVQGAGGNVSWKEGDTLWVKASGTWLAKAEQEDIFVPVDLPGLRRAFGDEDFSVQPQVKTASTLRPSIETLLHALMPHRIVVHLHPVEVLAYLVRTTVAQELQAKLGDRPAWSLVGYHKPGAELARAVGLALQDGAADVLFLANHGVVLGGENVDEVKRLLDQLIERLSVAPKAFEEQPHLVPQWPNLVPVAAAHLHQLALDEVMLERLQSSWALYPDHVVFLGAEPCCVDASSVSDVEVGAADVVFVKGAGVYSVANLSAAKLAQLQCYFDVLARQPEDASLAVLDRLAVAELLNWDAEKYRQSLKA